MKPSILFIILLIAYSSQAQFAVIYNKDGYTNVRNDASKGSKIIDSLQNGHWVYCLENNGNWTNIDYMSGNKDLNGYIYHDRYKIITNYPAIPIVSQAKNSIKLSKDSIQVIVSTKLFDKTKHRFRYYKDTDSVIQFIDNKEFWGDDGGIPKIEYYTITVKVGQKVFTIPKGALENLYEPNLDAMHVNVDKEKNIIYIQSSNSDGAGSYEVILKIESGVYKERFVVHGF